jgi:transposase InsO family protein
MNTDDLCQVLWAGVFCWIGLPSSIVGDRDARLTASQTRALCKSLEIQMKLSVAYHPQTDGQTEMFNRTLLALLRSAVNLPLSFQLGRSYTRLFICLP